jgi:hypothetical protein
MLPEKFYVYSMKLGGWISKTSSATTQLEHALEFTLEPALEFCRIRFVDEHVCFPVSAEHLKNLQEPYNGTR